MTASEAAAKEPQAITKGQVLNHLGKLLIAGCRNLHMDREEMIEAMRKELGVPNPNGEKTKTSQGEHYFEEEKDPAKIGKTIVIFGKAKGQTFAQVTEDLDYCKWVLTNIAKTSNPQGIMLREYLEEKFALVQFSKSDSKLLVSRLTGEVLLGPMKGTVLKKASEKETEEEPSTSPSTASDGASGSADEGEVTFRQILRSLQS